METWVIFLLWLLIGWVVDVAEAFTDTLKHYFLQMGATKLGSSMLSRTTLIAVENIPLPDTE